MPTITLPDGKKLITADTVPFRHEISKDLGNITSDGRFSAIEGGFWSIEQQSNGQSQSTHAMYHDRYHPTVSDLAAVEAEHNRIQTIDRLSAARYEEEVLAPLKATDKNLTRWYTPDKQTTTAVTTVYPKKIEPHVVSSTRIDPLLTAERGNNVDILHYRDQTGRAGQIQVQSGISPDELAVALHERGITHPEEASKIFHGAAIKASAEQRLGGLSKPLARAMGHDAESFLHNANKLKTAETTVEMLLKSARTLAHH